MWDANTKDLIWLEAYKHSDVPVRVLLENKNSNIVLAWLPEDGDPKDNAILANAKNLMVSLKNLLRFLPKDASGFTDKGEYMSIKTMMARSNELIAEIEEGLPCGIHEE